MTAAPRIYLTANGSWFRPDAVVIDMAHGAIIRDGNVIVFPRFARSKNSALPLTFRFSAMLLAAFPRVLSWADVIHGVYGERADGSPDDACANLHQLKRRSNVLLTQIGLCVHSRPMGWHCEVRPMRVLAPAAAVASRPGSVRGCMANSLQAPD